MELATKYRPAEVEPEIADRWNQAKAFAADPAASGTPYCIVIPPPNVTAALHMGHALNNTIQDVLIRWRRMCGDNAVWIPGTDHAGIATQTVVEKRVLAEEGKKRTDFERDVFVGKIQAWKDQYEKRITEQLKAMGCSCDWDRQRFTMDDMCARAVREAFFKLFKDGLIYRGKRLVNWDPATQTALADDEVEMRDVNGHFWYMRYPLVEPVDIDGRCVEYVTVATTRPETMLGDTAVAVNPKDPERAELIGQKIKLPIVNRIIEIIGDDYVVLPDPESSDEKAKYASGFLKVTPAHDPNDWEIGLRHKLDVINVMAPDGSISKDHGWPADDFEGADRGAVPVGQDRYKARKLIVKWFEDHGLLEEVRPYKHSVGHSYRSHVAIEPYLSDQWYVRVTDERLARAALRAMAPDQRAAPPASPDREGGGSKQSYLITFTTYGVWLHGDARGSVEEDKNLPGAPYLPENNELLAHEQEQLKHDATILTAKQRRVIRDTIQEVCRHRGWRLEACNVRTNHVHVVVHADTTPERVMNDFKSYATRRLVEADLMTKDSKVWTRHGSTRYLKHDASVTAACRYVLEDQGDDDRAVATDNGWPSGDVKKNPLPHGRGSLGASTGWEGGLRFHPERYAKTFQNWHENIRDWCISRQLWWGHRIPVWTKEVTDPKSATHEAFALTAELNNIPNAEVHAYGIKSQKDIDVLTLGESSLEEPYFIYVCLQEDDHDLIAKLKTEGFERDPDVLDTWFSSALWPFSTLGWPGETSELATWNPGSVLCTAREIITLWVSRMVMFNLYFRGRVPFTDVFIHAMIQDGDGRKMSKSLGNGVDPLDIIHSHGSDAMRYTLATMTTTTQDVRLPVAKDPETGRNTSDKFDLGRNFSNKLWNAVRFALGRLEEAQQVEGESASDEMGLADRWILSRLAKTVRGTDAALAGYEFSHYAQGLYDFFWRDLCDWYIEAIKPTVATHRAQQRVLALCIDASLRLLHPVMPFITEKLWEHLNQIAPDRHEGTPQGAILPSSDLLIKAAWPKVDGSLIDTEVEDAFGLVQEVVGAMRQVRTTHQVPPRQRVAFSADAPPDVAEQILKHKCLIETLANVAAGEVGQGVEKPDDAASASCGSIRGSIRLYLHGLVDAEAERVRLNKRVQEVDKNINALNGRLSNKKYVDKAPTHLVEQTRGQLESARKESDSLKEQLAAL